MFWELASPLQSPHKCSRFLEWTLLRVGSVSVVMSVLELEEGSSEHSRVFWFLNDEVVGCVIFRGQVGREAVVCLCSTMEALGSLLNRLTCTERARCGSLEPAGLLQWLVFATVPNESPPCLPPSPTAYIEQFLPTDVCRCLTFPPSQVFTRLLATELPPNNVCCHDRGAAEVCGLFVFREERLRNG